MIAKTPKLDAFLAELHRVNAATWRELNAGAAEKDAARFVATLAWNEFKRAAKAAQPRSTT